MPGGVNPYLPLRRSPGHSVPQHVARAAASAAPPSPSGTMVASFSGSGGSGPSPYDTSSQPASAPLDLSGLLGGIDPTVLLVGGLLLLFVLAG